MRDENGVDSDAHPGPGDIRRQVRAVGCYVATFVGKLVGAVGARDAGRPAVEDENVSHGCREVSVWCDRTSSRSRQEEMDSDWGRKQPPLHPAEVAGLDVR